ncbi:MAG: Uncharacterized protein G01um10145_805 [Microgenomates group bacterium Gr01-1014_5]|nr:MAG: Uncharacterized protein G01um10145_805 [Microgenomates group bacterium Gr01-1014_5]
MYFIYFCTIIILTAWLTRSVLTETFIFKRTFLDIPLLLFFGSQLIAAYFSIDQHTSIFGYYSRINGGLLSLTSYLLLYWAYVSNMEIRNTLYAIRCLLISASLIAGWGILEHFGISPSCYLLKEELNANCWVQDVQARVFATLGQPNWMAAYLVAVLPLSLITSEKLKVTSFKTVSLSQLITCYLLPVTLLLATLFTKSRSGLLGLGAAIAVYIFFLLPQKLVFRLSYLLVILISAIFFWHYNFADCFDLNPNQLTTSGGTESCKIRTIVWKGALDIWRNNPVFGTGPETFAYSYYNYRPIEHNNTSEWELLYNKAHNEYLNYAANTGTFGVVSYVVLIVFSVLTILQVKNKNSKIKSASQKSKFANFSIFNCNFEFCILNFSLLAGYASILVTNFFGFSTATVSLLFFLFPAMAVSLTATENSVQKMAYRKQLTLKSGILLAFILFAVSYTLFATYRYWHADTLYNKADKYGKKGLYQEAAKEMKNALFIRSNEPLYYNELAELVSFLAISQRELGQTSASLNLAKLAIDSSAVAVQISPYNINFLKNQSLVFARLSLIDPAYINQAIPPLEEAVRLAPTEPKIHYNLGVLYERKGEKHKAEALFKKALDLKPDYQDPKEAIQELQIK